MRKRKTVLRAPEVAPCRQELVSDGAGACFTAGNPAMGSAAMCVRDRADWKGRKRRCNLIPDILAPAPAPTGQRAGFDTQTHVSAPPQVINMKVKVFQHSIYKHTVVLQHNQR